MKTSDFYQAITDSIVTLIAVGAKPWVNPVLSAPLSRPLRHNSIAYRGINVIILWVSAMNHGFASDHWFTFKQALELGAAIRKGERGTRIYFAKQVDSDATDPATGEVVTTSFNVGKCYTVFNASQIDNLPTHCYPAPAIADPFDANHVAEGFIAATNASIVFGGSRACYIPSTDNIHMPCRDNFRAPADFYSTALHELAHWTSHETRANRPLNSKRFDANAYAFEELVAELSAAFLCADLGLIPVTRDDHASYLTYWLDVLKADKRAIFTAAALAEKAAAYLHSFSRTQADHAIAA